MSSSLSLSPRHSILFFFFFPLSREGPPLQRPSTHKYMHLIIALGSGRDVDIGGVLAVVFRPSYTTLSDGPRLFS